MEIDLPSAGLGGEDASSTWQQAAKKSCTRGRVKEQHCCATVCFCYTAATTQSQCCGMMVRDAAAVKWSTGSSPEQDKVQAVEGKRKVWRNYTRKWASAAPVSAFKKASSQP